MKTPKTDLDRIVAFLNKHATDVFDDVYVRFDYDYQDHHGSNFNMEGMDYSIPYILGFTKKDDGIPSLRMNFDRLYILKELAQSIYGDKEEWMMTHFYDHGEDDFKGLIYKWQYHLQQWVLLSEEDRIKSISSAIQDYGL